jgi:2-amino-4-hydroxy-6-hydroxymethyldihydropteridine diphosphokinase
MYVTDQPNFLNAVARGKTRLGPLALLSVLKQAEQELGRVARFSNGPREIDLDLLAYGSLQLKAGDRLIIPHPRISERRFVLAPWADLEPEWIVAGAGRVKDLLAQTKDAPESVWVCADAVLFV